MNGSVSDDQIINEYIHSKGMDMDINYNHNQNSIDSDNFIDKDEISDLNK